MVELPQVVPVRRARHREAPAVGENVHRRDARQRDVQRRRRTGRYKKFKGSFGQPKLIAVVEIDDDAAIVTDASWQTAPGPITFSCIYGGEDYDARLEEPDAANWTRGDRDRTAPAAR